MRRVLCTALAWVALACGGPEPEAPVAPDPGVVSAALPEAEPAAGPDRSPAGVGPAPGTAVVRSDGLRVDLEANDAPISEVLAEISARTGLILDVGQSGIRDRRITARIEDASLFEVLSLLLRDVDFSLDVAFDPGFQRHRVEALRIGAQRRDGEPSDGGDAPFAAALFELLDSSDPQVVLAALDALDRAGDAAVADQIEPLLDDEDPQIRDSAAAVLERLADLEAEPLHP